MSMKKNTFKADNYGEVLAAIHNMELISFEECGEYQGEYLAVLKDGDRLFYFSDYYGSCSGCDWLESIKLENDEVPYQEALDYCSGIKPKYIVPENMPLSFEKEEYKGFKIVSKPC